MSSTFRAGGERRYARFSTPNWEAFESAMGSLEGGEAVAFGSGMAAVTAALELVGGDATVAVSRRLYVGSSQAVDDFEARGRFRVVRFDRETDEAVATADAVLVEDPTNPGLERVELAAIIANAGGLVIVDNTVATPIGRRPLEEGADVVVHSATKQLAGHSDVLMGVVVVRSGDLAARLRQFRTLHGAVPGALESFLALRGLRTLALRVGRATATAVFLAERLSDHPAVADCVYPGIGALIALRLKGGVAAADAMIDRLRLWEHATSLGGVESTLERRARWAHESPDVSADLVRLSVGIESPEDLWTDLCSALGE